MSVLEFRVRASVRVKVRARVGDSWGTKCPGTKRLGYGMSGSRKVYISFFCLYFPVATTLDLFAIITYMLPQSTA